jgi:hypothetical protein
MYNPRGWDDSKAPVESASLASALTQPRWHDRILGGNSEAGIKVQCTWMSSGNNVEFSRELARRIVPIRLVAPIENPSERTGFRHDPLEAWMAQNRLGLLRACLVLCGAWNAAGRPAGAQRMGSYEAYARVLGGILDVAGVPGFLANRRKFSGKDRESNRWPALVELWYGAHEYRLVSVTDIYDLIFGYSNANGARDGGDPDLQITFHDIVGDGGELSQKQKLAHALGRQEWRVWSGRRITKSDAKAPNGSNLYRLADPEEGEPEATVG